MRNAFVFATLICLATLTLKAQPERQKFVVFDAPGASSAPQSSTYPLHGTMVADINARGEIVGDFNDDANTVFQTFIRYPDGRMEVSNDPSAGTAVSSWINQVGTTPYALNDAGVATGVGVNENGQTYAFVRTAKGEFTDFHGPQSLSWYAPSTRSFAINNRGQVTGDYIDYPTAYHGYIRSADGTITSFDAPDASFSGFWNGTTATSINSFGDVCGYYHDANAAIHSFLRMHDGNIIDFAVPGASTLPYAGAFATRITDQGLVTGFYYNDSFQPAGYVRYPDGQVSTITFPQIPDGQLFYITNINHGGDVLGTYYDANSAAHAFLLMRNGRLFKIDAPNAGTSANQGTLAMNLNDAGNVAGYFIDANNISHGFLWTEH
ncbi:hypothetical protein [Occallatibacter riparius]|uniref:DUF3466 family protein n=1 Tax=Occallatibacter riparius TaxID=1002689 RepID=A0A9J7BKQ1_9BACT|nr:hypothetical protein [Occallatibacter riparius]UWZ83179.1 hypothetical protein MOP44_21735 [Occallatibacter riparius]